MDSHGGKAWHGGEREGLRDVATHREDLIIGAVHDADPVPAPRVRVDVRVPVEEVHQWHLLQEADMVPALWVDFDPVPHVRSLQDQRAEAMANAPGTHSAGSTGMGFRPPAISAATAGPTG